MPELCFVKTGAIPEHVEPCPAKVNKVIILRTMKINHSAASSLMFFLLQAEDGIRDADVTGVQTCALPICAHSQFAVRGIKVLIDGIPQTLPDGQGQLTNLELGEADQIEVLRGSSSALFGNASGGVISIWTDPTVPQSVQQDVRVLFGTFDRHLARNWSKWQSSTSFRVGSGSGLVTVSRLGYTGQRQHSNADFRNLHSRGHFPLGNGWSPPATPAGGWDPRADNPGALTAAGITGHSHSAAAIDNNR